MRSPIALVEFPADDPDRALGFWSGLLEVELAPRTIGEGWQTTGAGPAVGVHNRGRGPGDSFSLPYFNVADMQRALEQVGSLGGSVVHPGESWSVCRDPEGNPFGLALEGGGVAAAEPAKNI
jgi:predicted enzyme related to lactoylglutathione lyase